jgi:hypothetical protein
MKSVAISFWLALASLLAATNAAVGEETGPCLKPSDPVAGILRKVTIRLPSNRELVSNWHIDLSAPVCVKIGDEEDKGIRDVEVVFAKSVDLKEVDDQLGMPVGVKGTFVYMRGEGDTASHVVVDAEFYDDLDDAGEIRRK